MGSSSSLPDPFVGCSVIATQSEKLASGKSYSDGDLGIVVASYCSVDIDCSGANPEIFTLGSAKYFRLSIEEAEKVRKGDVLTLQADLLDGSGGLALKAGERVTVKKVWPKSQKVVVHFDKYLALPDAKIGFDADSGRIAALKREDTIHFSFSSGDLMHVVKYQQSISNTKKFEPQKLLNQTTQDHTWIRKWTHLLSRSTIVVVVRTDEYTGKLNSKTAVFKEAMAILQQVEHGLTVYVLNPNEPGQSYGDLFELLMTSNTARANRDKWIMEVRSLME